MGLISTNPRTDSVRFVPGTIERRSRFEVQGIVARGNLERRRRLGSSLSGAERRGCLRTGCTHSRVREFRSRCPQDRRGTLLHLGPFGSFNSHRGQTLEVVLQISPATSTAEVAQPSARAARKHASISSQGRCWQTGRRGMLLGGQNSFGRSLPQDTVDRMSTRSVARFVESRLAFRARVAWAREPAASRQGATLLPIGVEN